LLRVPFKFYNYIQHLGVAQTFINLSSIFFQPSFNYPSDAEDEMKLQNVLNARRSILL